MLTRDAIFGKGENSVTRSFENELCVPVSEFDGFMRIFMEGTTDQPRSYNHVYITPKHSHFSLISVC